MVNFFNFLVSAPVCSLQISSNGVRYDEKEDADAIRKMKLLKRYGLNHQSVVVDIGSGTGQYTMLAAGTCARVVAVEYHRFSDPAC